jgi:hypothetical protein
VQDQGWAGNLRGANLARSYRTGAHAAQIVVDFPIGQNQQQLLANRLRRPALWTIERRGPECFKLVHLFFVKYISNRNSLKIDYRRIGVNVYARPLGSSACPKIKCGYREHGARFDKLKNLPLKTSSNHN